MGRLAIGWVGNAMHCPPSNPFILFPYGRKSSNEVVDYFNKKKEGVRQGPQVAFALPLQPPPTPSNPRERVGEGWRGLVGKKIAREGREA